MQTAKRRTILPGYPPIDPVACGALAARTNITSVAMKSTNLTFLLILAETKYNLLERVFIFISPFDSVFIDYACIKAAKQASKWYQIIDFSIFLLFLKTQKQRVLSVLE
jgi:hypothetical protein